MHKVKREKTNKKRWWGIVIILFLGMSFFSILGFYDKYYYSNNNKISGMASAGLGDMSNLIKEMMNLVRDILKPIFGSIVEDNEGTILRALLFVVLYLIISTALKQATGKRMQMEEKYSNIIAAIISLIAASFIPGELIRNLGYTTVSVIMSILILAGLNYIYHIDKGNEDGFTKWKKAFFSFLMMLLIMFVTGWSEDLFGVSGGEIFGLIAGIGLTISALSLVYYVFVYNRGGESKPPRTPSGDRDFSDLNMRGDKRPKEGDEKGLFRGREPSDVREAEKEVDVRKRLEIENLKKIIANYLRDLSILENNLTNTRLWMNVMQHGNDVYRFARNIGFTRGDLQRVCRNLVMTFNDARKSKEGINILGKESAWRTQALGRISIARSICTELMRSLGS